VLPRRGQKLSLVNGRCVTVERLRLDDPSAYAGE